MYSKGVFLLWFPPTSSHYRIIKHTEWEGTSHSLQSWDASQLAFLHTLTQHSTSTLLPEPETLLHPKTVVTSSLWEVISLPFCLLGQAWICNQVLTSLMSSVNLPSLVPAPHCVPLCIWGPRPDSWGGWIPLWIKMSVGAWWISS
jgi:hypothetical protein